MNETLDDIVAWIREIAQSWRQSNSYDKVTIGGLGVCDALEKIADRIEAARKRERGNSASMREALDSIAYTASMIAYMVGNGTRIAAMATEIIDKTAAALAAPPRNCDRFNSGDCNKDVVDASLAWDKFCAEHYPPGTPVVPKTPYTFWSWVFAQANESEVKS